MKNIYLPRRICKKPTEGAISKKENMPCRHCSGLIRATVVVGGGEREEAHSRCHSRLNRAVVIEVDPQPLRVEPHHRRHRRGERGGQLPLPSHDLDPRCLGSIHSRRLSRLRHRRSGLNLSATARGRSTTAQGGAAAA
jgi:hypothetical protein